MKKTTLRSLLLAMALFASTIFSACNTEQIEFVTPELSISPTILVAPSKDMCDVTFDVTTNRAWKVIIPEDDIWVMALNPSGEGDAKITLSMLPNTEGPRQVEIKVATTTVYATLKLTQPGAYEVTNMFDVTFGSPSGTSAIAGYTDWGASGISYSTAKYSSATPNSKPADIRITSSSIDTKNGQPYYPGASGGANVMLTADNNTFTISDLNVNTGKSIDYAIKFGCYSFSTPFDPASLKIEYSIDAGATWSVLTYKRKNINSSWGLATTESFPVPASATNLSIRFTPVTGQPRIDDVKLEAHDAVTVTAYPSVSTTVTLPADITTTTAKIGGTYTYTATSPVIDELGMAYKATDVTGDFGLVPSVSAITTPFSVSLANLTEDTDYEYKAYAKIGDKYYFGQVLTFKTKVTYIAPEPVAAYSDDFSSITTNNVAYEGAGWYFTSTDATITNGWKTSIFANTFTGLDDKSIQIAPYASQTAVVTAYAVLPPVNPSTSANDMLDISYTSYFNTTTDNSLFEVVVSENFTGNVTNTTWTSVTTLARTTQTAKDNLWKLTQVDLSAYASKTKLFIALRYVGKGDTYRVDLVQFGKPAPSINYLAPRLSGQLIAGTAAGAANKISIPYIYGAGQSVTATVTSDNGVSGTFTGNLSTNNGEYMAFDIPLTGTPTTVGPIEFTIAGVSGLTTTTVSGAVIAAGSGPVYTTNITLPTASNSTSAYYPEKVIVESVEYACLKLGTSSKIGTYEIPAPLPATESATLTMYGVAWATKTCPVTITVNGAGTINGGASAVFTCSGNAGAASTSPYTLVNINDTDNKFTAQLAGLTTASTITVASGTNFRAILFGINIK